MGSGYEALELVGHLSRIHQHHQHQQVGSSSSNDDTKKVILLFGNAGPMSKTVPRYLSTAISKRLRQHGIIVEERAMTQYVSMDRPMISSSSDNVVHNKYQMLKEVYPTESAKDHYAKYKDIKILNNRYADYNENTHTF